MAAVDLKSDIVKKGDGLARIPQGCFTFKMVLKFKPVVVTAVLILPCYHAERFHEMASECVNQCNVCRRSGWLRRRFFSKNTALLSDLG